MLYKTRGLVLNFIKYRETSIITKIYTEDFGIKSYIVNSVRSKSSKAKIGFFQPLTLLELVVYNKENSSLNRISEIKCFAPYKSIPFDVKKSAMVLFLVEVLNKTLKEENSNKELFQFLTDSFIFLDNSVSDYQNFHLQFLFKYSAYLGFSPSELKDIIGDQKDLIPSEEKEYLEKLMFLNYDAIVKSTNDIRRNALSHILKFFRFHVEGFGELNSEKILKEVLK